VTFGAPTQLSDLVSSRFIGDYAIAALADGPEFHVIYECAYEGQLSICFW
jgi:hypothetical protein